MVCPAAAPEGPDPGLYPRILAIIARRHAEAAQDLEAEREIADAERFAREDGCGPLVMARVLAEKVDVYRELGQLEVASEALEEALESLPRGGASSSVGWELRWREAVLSLAEGKAALAESELSVCLLEGAAHLAPLTRCRVWHFLGLACLALHRFEAVAGCFENASALYSQPGECLRDGERWWACLWVEARRFHFAGMEASFRLALESFREGNRSDLAVLLCVDLARFYLYLGKSEDAESAAWYARQLGADFGWFEALERKDLYERMTACGANLLVLERLPRSLDSDRSEA